MDDCEEVSEYGYGVEIVNIRDIHPLLHFDSALNDEIDIFDINNMTSLSSLVYLNYKDVLRFLPDVLSIIYSVISVLFIWDEDYSEYIRCRIRKKYKKFQFLPALKQHVEGKRDTTDNQTICDDENGRRLTLAYERLHLFPKTLMEQFSATLHTLDISHNEFEDLRFLKHFKHLTTLICDHNKITSETVIPEMPNLQVLWMNYCQINELYPWAKYLRNSCPNLVYLSLMGNTAAPSYLNGGSFYDYLQYRLFVVSLFPNLKHLDDRKVTKDQQQEAQHMYRRPFLERFNSKSSIVLPEYLKSVSNKLSHIFQPNSTLTSNQRNIIV